MNYLRNDKGMALVMVLILSVVCLAMSTGIIYFVSQSTSMSGSHKRYETAVQAANGGAEVTFQMVSARGDQSNFNDPTNLGLTNLITPSVNVGGINCIAEKLLNSTDDWNPLCNSSLSIDSTNNSTYDIAFDLGTYNVYAKVVDTVAGNTAPDTGLVKNAVVQSDSGEVSVQQLPYIYSIEVQSSLQNMNERAKSSILYFY